MKIVEKFPEEESKMVKKSLKMSSGTEQNTFLSFRFHFSTRKKMREEIAMNVRLFSVCMRKSCSVQIPFFFFLRMDVKN